MSVRTPQRAIAPPVGIRSLDPPPSTMNSLHYLGYRIGWAKPLTQTSAAERLALRQFATGKNRLAEIGVFHGVNTRALREAMASDGVLFAIDPFLRSCFGIRGFGWARRIAHRELACCNRGRVEWVEDLGRNAARHASIAKELPLDFLFIDGDHSWDGLKGDWECWSDLIARNGIVALHDSCNTHGADSERYTRDVILNDPRYQKIHTVDTLTVVRRI